MSIARIYDGLLIPWQNLHYTSLSIRISLTFHGGLTAVMTPYFLRAILTVALILVGTRSTVAADMPKLAQQDGRFGFLVDGKPFLVLGVQINNSSGWPASLPEAWPAIEAMHANTVEAPVYWEQMEPQPGKFDFTNVDELLKQARAHHVHLVLLWFGTWKNGRMHYVPEWIKTDTARFPRVIDPHGEPIDVISANSPANLEADKRTFVMLMRHLR